jgi:hypothetical protein
LHAKLSEGRASIRSIFQSAGRNTISGSVGDQGSQHIRTPFVFWGLGSIKKLIQSIFHTSFSIIFHMSFFIGDLVRKFFCNDQWKMENDIWKMIL